MLENVRYRVVFSGGRDDLVVQLMPPDFVAFEDHYNVPLLKPGTMWGVRYTYWLAWHAAKRTGVYAGEFDGFLGDITTVRPDVDDEVDADPLDGTPSPSS